MNYKQKNLIDAYKEGEVDVIIHQANCQGKLGAGFALSLALEFPEMAESFKQYSQQEHRSVLFGSIHSYENKILSVCSQYYTGECTTKTFKIATQVGVLDVADSYDNRIVVLENAINHIMAVAPPGTKIGIPLIASGLAASPSRKGDRSDLEYFKQYVAHVFDKYDNVTAYYL